MKSLLLSLSFLFCLLVSNAQAQTSVVLDTAAILSTRQALEQAEVLYSKEHLKYIILSFDLSSLYLQDPNNLLEWEDQALEALRTMRQRNNRTLYRQALQKLPRLVQRLFDSQIKLEEAEANRKTNPAFYAEKLIWRAKIFYEAEDIEAYDVPIEAFRIIYTLPEAEQKLLLAYAKRHLNAYILNSAKAKVQLERALNSTTDRLQLAQLMQQYGQAIVAQEVAMGSTYLPLDTAYEYIVQAMDIYAQQLGADSQEYLQAFATLSPSMRQFYALEQPLLERIRKHETNNDEFVRQLRYFLDNIYEFHIPTYDEDAVFEWVLTDIKEQYGVEDPYYTIVKNIEQSWDLSEAERDIIIQKKAVQFYDKQYGKDSPQYLEAAIELGNIYAQNDDDVNAERIYQRAFDRLTLLDQKGVAPPVEDLTLLQYYWGKVYPSWRSILIKEHNLNVVQQTYGLLSTEYWNAYFETVHAYYEQEILATEKANPLLKNGLENIFNEDLEVALIWVDRIVRLEPEYNIDAIRQVLPKVFALSDLEQLMVFPIDSIRQAYGYQSEEMGQMLEILADGYYYDTTQQAHAAIALQRYQDILNLYRAIGASDSYTILLDRITKNLTDFSPWTPEQVNSFFEALLKIQAERNLNRSYYYLGYVERYAEWLYRSEELVPSEQYFERIVRYFEQQDQDLATEDEAGDFYRRTLGNLGRIYRKTGRFEKSLLTYAKLYAVTRKLDGTKMENNLLLLQTANELGDLFYREKKYDVALQAFDAALKNMEPYKATTALFGIYNHTKTALLYVSALRHKGLVLFHTERQEEARLYYEEALEFVDDPNSPITRADVNMLLTNLADLALYDYQDELAERYYRKALKYTTDKEEWSIINIALADYYRVTGQDSLTAIHLSEALATDLKRVQENYTALSEKDRKLFLQPILNRFDAFLEYGIPYQNQDLLLQFFNSHLIVKGLSLETANNMQSICNVTENTVVRRQCLEMQNLRKELSKATNLSSANKRKINDRIDELEKNIGLSSRDLREIYDKNNRNLNFVDLKRLLYNMGTPVDSTMAIDFIIAPEKDALGFRHKVYYAAIVIPRHPYPHFVRLATEEELSDVLAAPITATSFNYITDSQESRYLYELVWEPLLPYINNGKYLHLCPTGILSRIAFGTLRTGNHRQSRVMDRWSIHYYGALRDLLHLKTDTPPRRAASALLVGGVQFDLTDEALKEVVAMGRPSAPSTAVGSTRGETFNALPETLEEVVAISRLFPNDWVVKLLSGALATEENLTDIANEAPDILHIATHGYFFPTPRNSPSDKRKKMKGAEGNLAASSNPLLRSGLALAGVNRAWKGKTPIAEGAEDGILTALEVANLDLFNTKLVVLSACETGRGDIDNTEGILGLRRAFKTAGAQQLIISLWKVPDQQTAELMELFYQRYLSGTSAHAAFEYAQKEMRKRYPNPYYWAAFLLIE
jgi:CHAT domain-containing protein/tetratricopeptide (TPR) repeat protein